MSHMEQKRNLYLLYAIALLQGMVFYGPIATLYRQASGISVLQITMIESISLALTICLELPWGIVADRIGYKRSFLLCCILYFLSKIVFWQADSFPAFLAERILLAVVVSGLSGVDTTLLYLSAPKEQAQSVLGIYNNLNMAGLFFASGIYSVFLKEDYRMTGFLTVISYGIAAFLAFWILEVRETQEDSGEEGISSHSAFVSCLKDLFTDRKLLLFLVGVALLNEAHQTITVFLNQPKYIACGVSASLIGIFYMIVTLSSLSGGLSARLTVWLGEKRSLFFLGLVPVLACLILAFTSSGFLAFGAILLFRICYSLLQPLQMRIQNQEIRSRNRATALSTNAVLIDLIAIVVNLVFGKLADIQLSLSLLFGALLCLCGLILILTGRHRSS